jgi:hypothetical protein
MLYVVASLRHHVRRPALGVSSDAAGRALRAPVHTGDQRFVVSDELAARVLERCQLVPEVSQVTVDFVKRVVD